MLAIATNAWLSKPGSSTNYNSASEIKTAESLIEAGYLAETSRGTSADKPELHAKLTEKGRAWVRG